MCLALAHNTRRNCRRKCRESSDMILRTALLVMCLITSIKVAFKQAIQSGKMYKHRRQVLDFTSEHRRPATFHLQSSVENLGYKCQLIVLVFGSLGHVHRLAIHGLCIGGLSKTRAKQLAKYCSISATIGSMFIWKR